MGSLWGEISGLPKTGQTIEYEAGDDGTYEKGYPKNGVHFVDNGDGTVTDNATGLMWVKDGQGAGADNGSSLNWSDAIIFCEGSTFAGYSDWRLPNVKELMSIVDYSKDLPSLDAIFINVFNSQYWSSTTVKSNTAWGWFVVFQDGSVTAYEKTSTYNILPVRGG